MIIAALQARSASSRLPGKVLKDLLGAPMLERQIERIRRAHRIGTLVVATSLDTADGEIEALCHRLAVEVYRGSTTDVLDRMYRAVVDLHPQHVVRLTGDCPLADPEVIDSVIELHLQGGYDYTSNTIKPTLPDGLDVEVIRFECMERAWREAARDTHREHVTPFIYQQPDRFKLGSYEHDRDLSALRWTVDEPEDFALVAGIYEALYSSNPCFSSADVLDLLRRRPDLVALNSAYSRNEGYKRSF